MAKDLYQSRQMYQSPLFLIILMPILGVLLVLGIDFCYKLYYTGKLEKATKTVLTEIMEKDYLTTTDKRKEYCTDRFKELGIKDTDNMVYQEVKDYYILIMYNNYFSLLNKLFFQPPKMAVARYKGYYNEYNEPQLEKIDTDEEEDEYLNDLDYNSDEPIKIEEQVN